METGGGASGTAEDRAVRRDAVATDDVGSRTSAVLVRQHVREGATDRVAALVADWARQASGDGIRGLVADRSILTLSVFLERGDGIGDGEGSSGGDGIDRGDGPGPANVSGPADGDHRASLVWYVEVDGTDPADAWHDPHEAIRTAVNCPWDRLDDHLASTAAVRVLADDAEGAALLVHEGLPDRPADVGTWAGDRPVVVGRDGSRPSPPDVVLVRVPLHWPLGTWFVRGFARVVDWTREREWIERRFRRASQSVLEEERMYTETIWLERTGDGYALVWYMEAEDMDRVVTAYEKSTNPVARISEVVLGRIAVEPERLYDPFSYADHELLVHAVDPDRPGFGWA